MNDRVGIGKWLGQICFHASAGAALAALIVLGSLQTDARYFIFGQIVIPRDGDQIDVRSIGTIYRPSIMHTYQYGRAISFCLVYLCLWYVAVLSRAIARKARMSPSVGAYARAWGLSRSFWIISSALFGLVTLELFAVYSSNGDARPGMTVAAPFAVVTGGCLLNVIRTSPSWNRAKPGCCVNCGYDLRATPDRCPECGTLVAKVVRMHIE